MTALSDRDYADANRLLMSVGTPAAYRLFNWIARTKPTRPSNRNEVVCILCGRVGTRGYVISSGNGDGTRDTYRCVVQTACDRRRRAAGDTP